MNTPTYCNEQILENIAALKLLSQIIQTNFEFYFYINYSDIIIIIFFSKNLYKKKKEKKENRKKKLQYFNNINYRGYDIISIHFYPFQID
jgi:mannose/fructose/N-acetylgalactosamine-specific phosphotransferase system component IID